MADVITWLLKLKDQASGLKAYGIQLADSGPSESMARLGAAIQIAVCESGRPGEAVVEANFVFEGAVMVDVLHDECQSPSGELVPKLFRQLARQGKLSRLSEPDPAPRQEPVPKPVNGAQQDLLIVDDDRCHPEVERPPGRTPGDVVSGHHAFIPLRSADFPPGRPRFTSAPARVAFENRDQASWPTEDEAKTRTLMINGRARSCR